MNVFYEEAGTFKVGAILADNNTSLQIEAVHGKRSKIKAASVLFRFDAPPLSEFMSHVQKVADELDPDFLWECCMNDTNLPATPWLRITLVMHSSPVEAAATLLLLQNAPMYFYKRDTAATKQPRRMHLNRLFSQEKKTPEGRATSTLC